MYRGRKIAVVVPAHNESLRVAGVIETMPAFVDRILVVDDASTDGTPSRIRARAGARTEIISRDVNGGVGAAIVSGYRRALETGADVIAVMAGDGQMDPADLQALLDPLVEDRADYAKGDRLSHPDVLDVMPGVRLVGNAILTLATRFATGLPLTDSQCGYTAISADALRRVALDSLYPRYGFPNDLLMKAAALRLRVMDVQVRPIYHAGPNASGILIRTFVPRVGWLLLAGAARRLFRRGEWAGAESGKRVLVLSSSYPRFEGDYAGGFVASVAERWARGARVTVVAPWDGHALRATDDPVTGLAVRRFRYAPLARWHRVAYGNGIEENLASPLARLWMVPFVAAFALRAVIKARRADIVVSNWLVPAGLAGAIASALWRRPHLLIEHGGGLAVLKGGRKSGIRSKSLRWILGRTDRVVCVSAALRDDLVAAAAEAGAPRSAAAIPVIPMGVPTGAPHGGVEEASKREGSVLFLGRLVAVKGASTLIGAMKHLPEATLTIAGDGSLAGDLKAQASGLADRVSFAGALGGEAKRAALSGARVLVVPSVVLPGGRTEGFPVVVLEGMAAGCVVVASDVGGIGEVLQDQWNGFLVKPGDDRALADRIQWIFDHPELADAVAARARVSVRAHDADAVADRLLREAGQALSRRAR